MTKQQFKSYGQTIAEHFNVRIEADVPSQDKYDFMINLLGYEKLKRLVPFTLEELKKSKNRYFNDLDLGKWTRAVGFTYQCGKADMVDYSAFKNLLRDNYINAYSPAQGVCLLKEVARKMIMEQEND